MPTFRAASYHLKVPDQRKHRGANPRDEICFAEGQISLLQKAVAQLSWLLTRGYPSNAAAELVGNRHALRARQRDALQRCSASEQACVQRAERCVPPEQLEGQELAIDGYNVLLTVEAALGGGVVLEARDGVFRDLSAMSRHYRHVAETKVALALIGEYLAARDCVKALWLFDKPISNSGKLAKLLREMAEQRGWPWEVELVPNPDRVLRAAKVPVATADSGILDHCGLWLNLARQVVVERVPDAWRIDLAGGVA